MAAAYNSVPIGIGVAGERYVESLLEANHTCHRIHRRRVHADLAVPIDGHEAEGWIDDVVHDLHVESVALADSVPISHAGAAQWIDANANLTLADCLKMSHPGKLGTIGIAVRLGQHG